MSTDVVGKITVAELPKIRAVAREGAVWSAVGSLAAWGAINVGAWFLLGEENRQFLSGLSHPSEGIYLLLYGGLVLGAAMLTFAALGLLTRSSIIIFLDGLSLVAVGLWNVTSDFIAADALRPYGYTITQPSTIWIVLGVCQIVWGVRQFSAFGRIADWNTPHLAPRELEDVRTTLRTFVGVGDDAAPGLVTASVTQKGPLGLDFMSRTTQYKGILCPEAAILVACGLNDCFTITRQEANGAAFGAGGVVQVETEQGPRTFSVTPRSVFTWKAWSGQPVQVADVQFAAQQKALTRPMLQSCLTSENSQVRTAAVAALPTIPEESAGTLACTYLDDPVPEVQAAALQACTQLRVVEAGIKATALLEHPDQNLRASAARYLSVVAQPSAFAALEKAMAVEETTRVKKELKRALRAHRQNEPLTVAAC